MPRFNEVIDLADFGGSQSLLLGAIVLIGMKYEL